MRAAAALLGGLVSVSTAHAQLTERVSITPSGVEGDGLSDSASISADGRYVAFESGAGDFVPGDTNASYDVFVRDRVSGTLERVSVSTAGVQGNFNSFIAPQSCITPGGRFVVYTSFATNLVPGTANGQLNIFLRDRSSATTELVSVNTSGAESDNRSEAPSISADGRFVAFQSSATDIVAGDTNGFDDVFVRDRQTGTTERVSLGASGAQGNFGSYNPAISADGRWVAFSSDASNLVSGDTNSATDIFVHDRINGTTVIASVSPGGLPANGGSGAVSVSGDGRFVAFHSIADNLVLADANGSTDVFVRDVQSSTTELVTVDSSGAQSTGGGLFPSISVDGRFVAFTSGSPDLVPGDTNGTDDVLVHDRSTGSTVRASVSTSGAQADSLSDTPSISGDGRFVAFRSLASNLVTNDTNGIDDIFVRDQGPAFGSTTYCFGDGSGTACPCGNSGSPGSGCASSVSSVGATLFGTGSATLSADTFVLTGSGMPNSAVLYFQGTQRTAGGAGIVFGDGLRCASGTITRLGTKSNVAGQSSYPAAGDAPISVKGNDTAGAVRQYQGWYRNAAAFCTPSTFNLTNGVEVTWTP